MLKTHWFISLFVGGIALLTRGDDSATDLPADQVAAVRQEIIDLLGHRRLFVARLSGHVGYEPCQSEVDSLLIPSMICSSYRSPPAITPRNTRLANRIAHIDDSTGVTGSWLRTIWAYHWGGGTESLRAPLNDLRLATDHDTSPAILNDLAVGLLVTGSLEGRPEVMVDALELFRQALGRSPRSPEIVFNAALAYELLGLDSAAVRAWEEYVRFDAPSPFAMEAAERLVTLRADQRQPIDRTVGESGLTATLAGARAKSHSVRRREAVEQVLIPAWGRFVQNGELERAAAVIDSAKRVAKEVERAVADHLASDIVAAIERDRQHRAIPAVTAWSRGVLAYDDGQYEIADRRFADAASRLLAFDNPLAAWAIFYRAMSQYQMVAYDDALGTLTRLRDQVEHRSYPAIEARIDRLTGLIYQIRARYPTALEAFMQAEKRAREVDRSLAARLAGEIGYTFAELGDMSSAWRFVYRGLTASQGTTNPLVRYTNRDFASRLVERRGYPALALVFQDAVVNAALDMALPAAVAGAYSRRAVLREATRDSLGRDDDLAQAWRELEVIEDVDQRRIVEGDISLSAADAILHSNPLRAIQIVKRASVLYRATDYRLGTNMALLIEARAELQSMNYGSAAAAFEKAVAWFEQERGSIPDPTLRASFYNRARLVYDGLVQVLVRLGRSAPAFEFAESARARLLLDRSGIIVNPTHSGRHVPLVDQLKAALDPGTALLSFTVLDDKLLAWLVDSEELTFHSGDVSRAYLANLIDQVQWAMQRGLPTADSLSAELFQYVIAPFDIPAKVARLVIVPDRELHQVPFAALRDSESREYLIERFAVNVVPSARWYTHPRRGEATRVRLNRILVIGDPEPVSADLPPLPGARREALQIAALYSRSTSLLGDDAHQDAFLERAPTADVIHFAGHAVYANESLAAPYLALPGRNGKFDARLAADSIAQLRWTRPRLVVLSGCATAAGEVSAGEGPMSLARAFLDTGVNAVLSTLWTIPDEDAVQFFVNFHENFIETGDTVAALRTVQLQWLRKEAKGASPYRVWAGVRASAAP